MFTIPAGPELAPLFTAPRVRGLSVAADRSWYAVEVDEIAAVGGTVTRTVRARGGSGPPVRFPGWQVTALPGRRALLLAPAAAGRGTALWWRNLDGGEASEVVAPPGGVTGYAVAADAVVYATRMHPGTDAAEDARLRRARLASVPRRCWPTRPAPARTCGSGACGCPGRAPRTCFRNCPRGH